MNSRKPITILATLLAVAAAGVFGHRALADRGIPSPGALSYQGTLSDSNGPIDGVAHVEVALFDTAFMDIELCRTTSNAVTVSAGRFELELNGDCTDAVTNETEAWVAVSVDVGNGLQAFPLERLHAAPYAVSARRADNGVPLGTVIDWWRPTPATAIPDGWEVCDGTPIVDPTSPLVGTDKPDLIDKFARGADPTDPNLDPLGFTSGGQDETPAHQHRWSHFNGNDWWSFSAGGSWIKITAWGDGMDSAGSGHNPLSRPDNTGGWDLFTAMHPAQTNMPAYVGLIKLCRVR